MIGRMVVAATAAGIFVLFCDHPAKADDDLGVAVVSAEDDGIHPGSRVSVFGTCAAPDFSTVPVVSPVLDPSYLHGGHDPTVVADARVKINASRAVWPVAFRCGATTVRGYLRIVPKLAVTPRLHGSEIEALLSGFAAGAIFVAGLGGLLYRGRRSET